MLKQKMINKSFQFVLCLLFLIAPLLFAQKSSVIPSNARAVVDQFQTGRMKADLQFLSSDLLEGRGTGARGGNVAAAYIATQFELAGLKPMGDNKTYLQKVPLIGLTTQPQTFLEFIPAKGDPMKLKYLDDFVANAQSLKTEEKIDAPMIFVGFGVNAPEFGWNDYAGLDVKGKVVLAFVNDPPSQDPAFFGGKAMTYYGRWTYKYEEATRQGAAGILLIHNTEMASYGWQVVRNSWSGEQAYLANPLGAYAIPMAGWITEEVAKKTFAAIGMDYAAMMEKAKTKGFQPIELPLRVQGDVYAKVRDLETENVAGLLEGSDPKLRDQAIVYTAHYDHLGIGNPVDGDNIYNGAVDNASGTAFLIELARAYSEASVKPSRSVLFLSVTGEERGLKGSEYFGKYPTIPAKKILIDLNFDGISLSGKTADVVMTGADRTSVWPIVQEIAKALNLKITPEAHPEAGSYYRSDHFSFARVGVPAFSVDLGNDYPGKPPSYGEDLYKEYNQKHYHQPSDEYDPTWDYSGAKQLAELGIYIGWSVAELPGTTGWRAGDEFEKARK
jgi:Zn-dependent M28 family amino/carboxypeptidase